MLRTRVKYQCFGTPGGFRYSLGIFGSFRGCSRTSIAKTYGQSAVAELEPDGMHRLGSRIPHRVWKIGIEADRIARLESVGIERDCDSESSFEHYAIFPAAVRLHFGLAFCPAADVDDELDELRVRVEALGQALPAKAMLKADATTRVAILDRPALDHRAGLSRPDQGHGRRVLQGACVLEGCKELGDRHHEHVDQRIERLDRRRRLSALDLRDQARRNIGPACRLSQAHPLVNTQVANTQTKSAAGARTSGDRIDHVYFGDPARITRGRAGGFHG